MSNELEKLQSPQIVISFMENGAVVDLKNWEKKAVSPNLVEGSFFKVHQAIHQYRANALHRMQVEDAKKKDIESKRDPLTEGVKHG